MKNKIYTMLLLLLLTSFTLAQTAEYAPVKQYECITLKQTCSSCSYVNISVSYPNSTLSLTNGEMASVGSGLWTYDYCETNFTGRYDVNGEGDLDGTATSFDTLSFDVTENGKIIPEGMPIFMLGLMFIIFLTACFFLFLSTQMHEVGFKIFFMLAAIIFLMASFITGYMVAGDGNVASEITSTTLALVIVLGGILVIFFAYILIRQTINALDLYNIKRGREWSVGAGSRVGGFNSKRAY